jgi:hypothetical protein
MEWNTCICQVMFYSNTKIRIKITLFPFISARLRILSKKKLFPAFYCPMKATKVITWVEYRFITYTKFEPIRPTFESESIVITSITVPLFKA